MTTNTNSKYAILIAFPRQQWLRERSSVLSLRALPLFLADRSQAAEDTEDRHRLYSQADRVCSFRSY
jgi:hypothetical protein